MSSVKTLSSGIKQGIRPGIVEGIGSWWQQFPRTVAEGAAAHGVTYTSILDFAVSATPLADLVAANHLSQGPTAPLYRRPTPFAGRFGITFADNTTNRFDKTGVFDLDATTSGLFVGICYVPTLPAGARSVFGKRKFSADFNGYEMFFNTDGSLTWRCDHGVADATALATSNHAGQWFEFAACINRATNLIEIATSKGDYASASIAGFGTLTDPIYFSIGNARGASVGMTMAWFGVALGANAEGHNLQALIARTWRGV